MYDPVRPRARAQYFRWLKVAKIRFKSFGSWFWLQYRAFSSFHSDHSGTAVVLSAFAFLALWPLFPLSANRKHSGL